MRNIRTYTAALALLVGAGSAQAADLYTGSTKDPIVPGIAAPATDWTGFYVGVNAGYGWAAWDGKLETTAGHPKDNYAGYDNPYRTLDGDGVLAGGQIGFNKQLGAYVIGLEADADWSDISGSATYVTDDYRGGFAKKHSLDIDYFGTVRGRVGYAVGNVLPYVTGGFAWGHANGALSVSYPNPPGYGPVDKTSNASVDEYHYGWTVGGGLEWALSKNWSVKGEYLHIDLGERGYLFSGKVYNGAPFNTDSFRSSLALDVVRVGLNYRW